MCTFSSLGIIKQQKNVFSSYVYDEALRSQNTKHKEREYAKEWHISALNAVVLEISQVSSYDKYAVMH